MRWKKEGEREIRGEWRNGEEIRRESRRQK
jgi:hypothetical protein